MYRSIFILHFFVSGHSLWASIQLNCTRGLLFQVLAGHCQRLDRLVDAGGSRRQYHRAASRLADNMSDGARHFLNITVFRHLQQSKAIKQGGRHQQRKVLFKIRSPRRPKRTKDKRVEAERNESIMTKTTTRTTKQNCQMRIKILWAAHQYVHTDCLTHAPTASSGVN